MNYIIYGAVGVIAVLLLLFGGCLIGWKLRVRYEKHNQRVVVEAATEEEKRKVREEQEAFTHLMGYNVGMAYGLTSSLDELTNNKG